MIEEAFVTLLADFAPVYPSYLPPRAGHPAIVYRRITTTEEEDHDGPTGNVEARFDFTIHADTHTAALALVRQVAPRLKNPPNGYAGANVKRLKIENVFDLGIDLDSKAWRMVVDTTIQYKE